MAQLQRQVRQLRMLLMSKGDTGSESPSKPKENVKVICRFRPKLPKEMAKKEGNSMAWDFSDEAHSGDPKEDKFDEVFSVQQDKHDRQHMFRFDHVLRPEASQSDVY